MKLDHSSLGALVADIRRHDDHPKYLRDPVCSSIWPLLEVRCVSMDSGILRLKTTGRGEFRFLFYHAILKGMFS